LVNYVPNPAPVVQKAQERRRLWECGKGFALTTFPQYGGGGVMSLRIGARRETDKRMHTGHFYFALTNSVFFVALRHFKW
jgi:hypothetical protein